MYSIYELCYRKNSDDAQTMEYQQQMVQSAEPSDIDFIEEFNADDFLSHLNSGANQRYA